MRIKDYILSHAEDKKVAIVDGERNISYRELFTRAAEVSEQIKTALHSRSHIMIIIPNSTEYVVAFSAIILSDNVVVPVYAKSSIQEIETTVDYCDAAMIITDSKNCERLLNGKYSHKVIILNIETLEMVEKGNHKKEVHIASPENVRIILGTSGSIDIPKKVMLSDENLISNSIDIINSLGYSKEERILAVLPFPFVAGNTSQLIVTFVLGATLYIYSDPLHPRFLFSKIKEYGITSTTMVAPVMSILLDDEHDYFEEAKTLRIICFGGGQSDSRTIQKMKRSPLRDMFVHMYGQTEASPRVSHLFLKTESNKLPSAGKPIGQIKVCVDCSDKNSKIGEILVKGKNVMVGYYKSNSTPIENGWLRTGDLGYIDDEGYIYIVGRKKNLIIYSGMNIIPEEVENVINGYPGVKESIVFGEKNNDYGEVPVADVVLKVEGAVTEKDLKEHCKEFLSHYKVPVRFEFVESFKRTYNGKIARKGVL